jgi:LPPG:FO 2-phospho-L-lactate transferase
MARALDEFLEPGNLGVIVNVGDDDVIYGVHVAADLDTVLYTMAGTVGEHGWGLAGDTFAVLDQLERLGIDTTFRLGDADLANCLYRTNEMSRGATLADVTDRLAGALGIEARIMPVSNDPVRTKVQVAGGQWLDFQEYFVRRGHRDKVADLRFEGAEGAAPAPGVIDTIEAADVVVIAPSNPPLSVWPILAIPGVREAIHYHEDVVAVSPLFGGIALKGPAVEIMRGLGLPEGNEGVLSAYGSLLNYLVVDTADAADVATLAERGPTVVAMDTLLSGPDGGAQVARAVLDVAI